MFDNRILRCACMTHMLLRTWYVGPFDKLHFTLRFLAWPSIDIICANQLFVYKSLKSLKFSWAKSIKDPNEILANTKTQMMY